ncbi:hypothetical protein [Bacillus safensis]|uniref:hypothetical protein n=1 Tax=Bacillus safensis TaxID=561879 RepID=UPI002E1C4C92|nr:hypothetical protein [Bacillus safensis]
MILGVFLNGYKSYPKSVFIPITSDVKEKYSVYIGTNGIGKSGILEAIDVFLIIENGMQIEVQKKKNVI